jgi:prephenate dehydrogenase
MIMQESNSLRDQNIAIVGLGLMGASVAMGLRGHCKSLLGAETDSLTCQFATAKGIVDVATDDLRQILPEADVLILATPVSAALEIIAALPGIHNGSKLIVTDVTSTKVQIMQALEALPSTPAERTSERTKALALELVEIIGGRPHWIDAETHDRTLAATSHAPHLLAVALTHATEKEYAKLSGGGLSSATRLASTPTSMMLSMVMTNAENTIAKLRETQAEIEKIIALMEAGDEASLEILLNASHAKREEIMYLAS